MSNINLAYFSDLNPSGFSKKDQEVGEVCIANISPQERQIRLIFAVRQLIITLLTLAVMIALHLNPLWRFLLLFMFSASTVSYFQARDKT